MPFLNRRLLTAFFLIASLCLAALAQNGLRSGVNTANLDTGVSACTDFYQFANGGWLANNPIPAAFTTWGTTSKLAESNRERMRQILEDAAKNSSAPAGSNEQKIGAFYGSCMDEARIEAEGAKPLTPELARIDRIKSTRGLLDAVAHMHTAQINVAFGFGALQDFKDSSRIIAISGQGGLGLPNRDYYTKDDERSKTLREAYVKHIANMFQLLGDTPERSAAQAQVVMTIENELAKNSRSPVELRDIAKQYNKMNLAQLKKLTPNIKWTDYFKAIGMPSITEVNVSHPEFFQALDRMLKSVPLDQWKTYLRWHLVRDAAPALSSKFVNENFEFYGKTLTGAKELQPRWRRCVLATDAALGEALGEVYVRKYFTPESKARMNQLVKNLLTALREDLSAMDWMSQPTRARAIAKLDAFVTKIGYPDRWRDYSALKVERGSYIENLVRAAQFEHRRDLNKIGKPVDRAEWFMTPGTVNAYNNFLMNEIVFPAGILQPPYFDPSASDDAFNYGAIGAVIGHEVTHGFDDQGRQFDPSGNLADWWTPEDAKNYQERAGCVEKQFSGFKIEEGLFQQGKLVLGESVADLGGLKIAYRAFQKSLEGKPRPPVIDGFTPEQRFFLGWAQVWGRNYRPEAARLQATTDPHPLSRFRVNGPLSNMPEFATAFQCKMTDAMVRAENERCQVW